MRHAVVFALALVLPGCAFTQDASGQGAIGPGAIAHQGAGDGIQTSAPLDCGRAARLDYAAQVGSGNLRLVVRDGTGSTAFARSLPAPGQAAETLELRGAAGDWVVEARRTGGMSGPYSGQYTAQLAC